MCTNPVQRTITYKGNFSRKTVTVPCGKCAECRAKLQSEFAALSCLEAKSAGSIGFITLTYRNTELPIMMSNVYEYVDPSTGDFVREVNSYGYDDFEDAPIEPCAPELKRSEDRFDIYACPSLRRSDVQKAIKRYREDYYRRHGERCDFRFTFFGEYGERQHRPHYHMLVYGLDRVELDYFCKQWTFGFTDCRYIEHFNADGSDAFSKVSRYVSKYVGKQDFLPDFVREGFAERPRKQSSIKLGRRDVDVQELQNFILPETVSGWMKM